MSRTMNLDERQKKALDLGFKYWRAPDAHGVICTQDQAIAFMQEMLGVEVEIKNPKPLDPKLVDAVEEFIAEHDRRNPHRLFTSEIVAAFPNEKPKTIKRIVHELR